MVFSDTTIANISDWSAPYGPSVWTTPSSVNTGQANTTIMMNEDGNAGIGGVQPHEAAAACRTTASGTHGKSDWYLPAVQEMKVIFNNYGSLSGFTAGYSSSNDYWASNEYPGPNWATLARLVPEPANNNIYIWAPNKNATNRIRCARR